MTWLSDIASRVTATAPSQPDPLVGVVALGVTAFLLFSPRGRAVPVGWWVPGLTLACAVAHALALAGVGGVVVATLADRLGLIVLCATAYALTRAGPAVEEPLACADVGRLRLLEAAVSACSDGVMVAEDGAGNDAGLRIVYANPAFERMTGYSAAEAVGQSPSILHDSASETDAPSVIRSALRGHGPVRLEVPSKRKDGSRVWAEWQVVPVQDDNDGLPHWVAVLRDTTERRQTQDELRQTRDFLSSLLENIPVPVYVTDGEDRYRLVNPAWERAVGVSREQAVGRPASRLLPAPAAETLRRQNATVRRQHKPVREEVAVDLGHGPRSFLTVRFPVPSTDGPNGVVGAVAVDVTEQTRAEEAVRKLNAELKRRVEELEAIIDLSPVGIAVAEDSGCRHIRANRALREMLGLPPEPTPEMTPPPERLRLRARQNGKELSPEEQPLYRCVTTGQTVAKVELAITLPDGDERIVENSVRPLFDEAGRVRGCVGVYTDMTARVRAESALRDHETLLRNIITHIPVGVFWKDRNCVYIGCNDIVARDFGLTTANDVVGRTDLESAADHAEAEFYRECDRQVMATEQPLLNLEETQTRVGGARATLLTSKVPLRDRAGAVVGVLGVYQDITDLKRLEEQYRQSQKMEAVGRLAGGIAHDFNNLLTVINGYSEMLRGMLLDTPEALELADEVYRAGERAANLTRQLLAFGRRTVLEPRVLDLNAAVADAGRIVRRLIGEDVELKCNLGPEQAWVRADAGQLDQVILNLVVNARDSMPHGGRVTLRTATQTVIAADLRDNPDARTGPHVVLAVRDTGCGMTDEVRARIFEPFFTTKEKGKGTGLGLATVYGIVTQAGGHIRVTSAPGQGSEFAVYLPRTEPASGTITLRARVAPRTGTETVLLAEDEEGVRGWAGSALRAAGYTVLEAPDGREAIRVAEQHAGRIDALVTDVVMPRLGGRALAETLSNRDTRLKVLFMSGYTDDTIVRGGVEGASVAFLQKPFTATALTRKLREVLDESTTIG